MLLQIDATVQYALATKNEVVTQTDLSVDSPYNTYKYKGLPAGPICNPGLASLEAAVKPETHNYYYYVLKVRGESEHTFAENYEDFLTAKAAYQATFNN
ncbi:Endolytic murein transglycosylase [bioreactor metagenome]|uniref:Endolytic murein transglycosylase n=1 Tax=bioreactor metagenome TaxID=1076179 RepID=A0A645D1T9_9ZZZZ